MSFSENKLAGNMSLNNRITFRQFKNLKIVIKDVFEKLKKSV
jgi:hypothetical protein